MSYPYYLIINLLLLFGLTACSQNKNDKEMKQLSKEEAYVIVHKGTERPFSGKYNDYYESGTYTCKRCGAALYKSDTKFNSHCGWPSFDDEIDGAVKHIPDADGQRTEIVCANCEAHLGHVFLGEGFTDKDTRHCVNSISLQFEPMKLNVPPKTETAYFAGGCFWGTEYYLEKAKGVISASVGYMGGQKDNPTYQEVCYTNTGHAEVVEVKFDADKTDFETLARLFFEIHDPTQVNRQGPDVGEQYRSEIFYTTDAQKATAQKLIKLLEDKGYHVATQLTPATDYWVAEDYHQDYYDNRGGQPYCHAPQKRF